MNPTEQPRVATTTGTARIERRVPGWAAGLMDQLARERPTVVPRERIQDALAEVGSDRDVEATIRELQRLGWLKPLHIKGVWAYLPPGETEIIDPYIDLRAWRARDPKAVFALAGEAAAWHLGYIDRRFAGRVAVWIPEGSQLPHGLRNHLSLVTAGWREEDARRLQPTPAFLHRRKLDMTAWADGLPGLGPEALLVQLATRPASFRVWADLVPHLARMAEDADPHRIVELLRAGSSSAWQRAAYLLHSGGDHGAAVEVMRQRPPGPLAKAQFGTGPTTLWAPEFGISDHLVAPLQGLVGKA